jgi:2-oxoglutarate dehydrogenase E2 component (dihydrolipoamide succinyltransferase)
MAVEIKVPSLGESVSTATVARWMKAQGEAVAADEPLVELETDKVTVEVNAPAAGTLESIVAAQGAEVAVGAVLGLLGGAGAAAAAPAPAAAKPAPAAAPAAAAAPVLMPSAAKIAADPVLMPSAAKLAADPVLMPSAAKLAADRGIDPATLAGTGKDGRITKGDVLAATPAAPVPAPKPAAPAAKAQAAPPAAPGSRGVRREKMSRLRTTIARRLKDAQNTAAILTTFNEIDMSAAMALRAEYKDAFEKKHGVRLGFMSFFVRAACAALREIPAANAAMQNDELVFHDYVDMGIAVSGPTGLVVPVLRNAEALSMAGIEAAIGNFGKKARDGALTLEDMAGGTFSITNGGVFGSLMSTPILNPPQSAILGMHKIQDRPVAIAGKVEIRPMMYVALSYDHRVIDGREAVTTLVRIKEAVEDPRRLLLEI